MIRVCRWCDRRIPMQLFSLDQNQTEYEICKTVEEKQPRIKRIRCCNPSRCFHVIMSLTPSPTWQSYTHQRLIIHIQVSCTSSLHPTTKSPKLKTMAKSALSCGDVVFVFDRNTLSLRKGDRQLSSLGPEWGLNMQNLTTHHMIDFVHADQPRGKLEHVVAQRDDDELSVLGALFDVSGDNRDLCRKKSLD